VAKISLGYIHEGRNSNKHTADMTRTKKLIQKIIQSSDDLVKSFGQKAVEAVIKSIRNSLDDLWRVLICKDALTTFKNSSEINHHFVRKKF